MSNNNNEYQDKPTIIHDGDKIKMLAKLKREAFNLADMAFRMHSYSEIVLDPVDLKSRKRMFKFDHIVVKTKTRSEFNYDLLDEAKFIDATYVMNYPEDCIVLVDASKGLNVDFFWYLKIRIDLLLALVNMNYDKYNDIEDCAAFRDLMSVLCFINKYSDKFDLGYRGSNAGKFILIRCYDIPGIYFKVIPTVAYTFHAAPKSTMIVDNPRYDDSGKETKKFSGAFVTDPNFKPKKIEDLDIATLYPVKKDPMNFNPAELLRKLALEHANYDIDKKQLDWFEQINQETVKREVRKKKTDVASIDDFVSIEHWKNNLELYINQFNALIKDGMTLDEAWKSDPGINLKRFIDCLLKFDGDIIYKFNIDFAIVVGEDNQLKLGKSSDLESMKTNIENEKDNDSYLVSPGDLVSVGKEDDKRFIRDDKIGEVFSHISLKDLITIVENNKVPTDYIGYLKRLIDIFNNQLAHGVSIEKVWDDRKIGRLLRTFINNLTEAAGESDDYDINFSIIVTDSGRLKLGRFADTEKKFNITNRSLSKVNESVSVCYEHESPDEEPATMIISSDKSTVLFNEMTDEQIANNYEDILRFFINGFNIFIDEGMDIKEAWKTNIGKDLISFINYIFDLSTKDKFDKSINFAIIVDNDYKLRLGKYSDFDAADPSLGLTSPGNFIRNNHSDDEEDTDSDQQQ